MLLQYLFYTIQLSTLVLSLSIPPLKVVHPAVKAKNSETKPIFNIIPKYNTANKVVKESTKNVTKTIKQAIINKPMSAKLSPLKPVTNSVTPKSNTSTTTTSNRSDKVFRMLGQPVQGYQLSNGTFSHVAYSKAMKSLAKRQKSTQSKVYTSKSKKLERRTNSSVILFGSDLVNYPTPLLTTFGIGTPPQQIPFFFNMESSTSVVFSKNSTCSAGGGYDIDASSSVKEIAQYKGGDILLESPSESIDEIAINGTYISDQIIFSYNGLIRATLATIVYAETLYLSRQCFGQVGLAAYSTYTTYADEVLDLFYTAVGGFTSVISMYIGVTEPQQYPLTYQVEIMIGARDRSKFTGKMYQIAVSKSKSFYTNSPWKLNFGPMIVNGKELGWSAGTVTFSLLHLGIHLGHDVVKPIVSPFRSRSSYQANLSIVTKYDTIGGAETYQSEGGPEVYTYPCRLNPEVSFTIPGTKIVLDINPDDFNMGFHPTNRHYVSEQFSFPTQVTVQFILSD